MVPSQSRVNQKETVDLRDFFVCYNRYFYGKVYRKLTANEQHEYFLKPAGLF